MRHTPVSLEENMPLCLHLCLSGGKLLCQIDSMTKAHYLLLLKNDIFCAKKKEKNPGSYSYCWVEI